MKTVLLLRHAKSDHGDAQLADHDRPLNERGKRDAPRVGERLLAAGLTPDAVLSSTAKRARKTAEKVARASGFAGELQLLGELYLAPPSSYLAAVSRLPEEVRLPLIVGHNPGMQHLLNDLTRESREFPTAALARIEFEISRWPELDLNPRGRLVELWLPRELE